MLSLSPTWPAYTVLSPLIPSPTLNPDAHPHRNRWILVRRPNANPIVIYKSYTAPPNPSPRAAASTSTLPASLSFRGGGGRMAASTARTVKDVNPHEFVKAYSAHLKRSGKVTVPDSPTVATQTISKQFHRLCCVPSGHLIGRLECNLLT